MSHLTPPSGPVADARATLEEHDHPAFDRLAGAVLGSPSTPLGPLLRAQLPGTAGVRWLNQEQLSPTTRPGGLTSDHWLSLFAVWSSAHAAPTAGGPGARRSGGRPSTSGHGKGAGGRPRWGQ
ncbi:MAG TPA: hypothetical protein VGN28_01450 [Blastococcus sp.]|nr:hypothetical protein [Blastococcus sp.]